MKLRNLIGLPAFVLGLVLVLAGCRLDDNRLRGHIKIPLTPDFLQSQFIINTTGLADGVSDLHIQILLRNSNGRPVPDYRPEFEVTPGAGVMIPHSCTLSDANGYSSCVLRSHIQGEKTLRLTNALVGLEGVVFFERFIRRGQILGLISASETGEITDTSAYWGEYSLGDFVEGVHVSTASGRRGVISVQGVFSTQ